MNVIIIMSDEHDFIGVAKNYKNAIDCLLEWSGDELCYINNDGNYIFLTDKKDFDEVYHLTIEEFNKKFDGVYYLLIERLWQ